MTPAEIQALCAHMTETERAEFYALIDADLEATLWRPLPGPQTMAYESTADVIGFGGSAGGGKSDLALGKALTKHHEVMVMRREGTQLQGILSRLTELLGTRDGYNGQERIWRGCGPRGVTMEFGSVPNLGDETKYQGRPHDLLVFDEAANFLEQQVTFLLGWNRSTRVGVSSQALLTFNPPTTAEGRWVIDFFAPWLDRKHEMYPTPPGEIRYCVTIPGDNGTSRHVWVADRRECVIVNGELVFDFDRSAYTPEDIVTPQSRTFIPSRISDNPYLAGSGYMRVLQAMPEPLRSQMLYGDFQAGMSDDPWQVIPTAWVEAAQARWTPRSPKGEMLTLGVDVARGGKDYTVLAAKHKGMWFDRLQKFPGKETPDGQAVVGQIIGAVRDQAPVLIDVIGVGASPYDLAKIARQDVHGINVSEKSTATDKSGRLSFANQRSELWWKMREALDPVNDTGITLPPDNKLLADLCAPKWEIRGMTIFVEGREAIYDRIGRSPDDASAVILALIEMPKRRDLTISTGNDRVLRYEPMDHMPGADSARSLDYDPLSAV